MEINQFIKNFSEQFDETELSQFTPTTVFKDLDEWSSLMALSIMAMVDDEYDVRLKGEDIRNSVSILDLFNIVKSQK
ncbi:MAG: acyl carrier protein [Bacteroidales bacterium]